MIKQNKYNEIIENRHNLKIGETYKYKQLCEALNTKYTKSADCKKAQLKVLDSVVEYQEVKRSTYLIKSFRNEIKQIEDGRGKSQGSRGNNTIYADKIFDAFLCRVVNIAEKYDKEDIILIKSIGELMRDMTIRNKNYEIAKYTPYYYSQQTNTDVNNVKKIVQEKDSYDYSAFNSVYNALDKSELCIVINTIYVKVNKPLLDEHGNIKRDKDDKVIYSCNTEYREATKEEFIEINNIKRNVRNDMGYNSMWYIINNEKLSQEFYRKVDNLTFSKLGIIRNYPKRELRFKKSTLMKYLQKFKGLTYEYVIYIGNQAYSERITSNIIKKAKGFNNGTKILRGDNCVMLKENFIRDTDIVINNLTDTEEIAIKPITLDEEMEIARQYIAASVNAKV